MDIIKATNVWSVHRGLLYVSQDWTFGVMSSLATLSILTSLRHFISLPNHWPGFRPLSRARARARAILMELKEK